MEEMVFEDLTEDAVKVKAIDAAALVLSKTTTSVSVLENLRPLLTNVEIGKRKLGLTFLSCFLSEMKKDFLNEEECRLFAQFYKDRMNDHHSLIPDIVFGGDSIFRFENLHENDLCQLFRAFFTQIHVQSQIVTERRIIFHVVEYLLNDKNRRNQLQKNLGSEFVLAFIQAVDAEKDPINMKVIFGLWPIVLKNFPLEPFEEDVFEAMSCYFPIDFSPPKGSEILVTKEDLVLGLRNSLSCSAIFAPLAMPLYLEKLDSDLNGAKIDANLTMIQSLPQYSPSQIFPHLGELWGLLKKEILGIKMNVSEEVIQSCHQVIFQITLSLAKAVQILENREILEKWLNMVWQDIGRHLKDIELKFMSLSIGILKNVISTSAAFPSAFMLDKAMPILLQVHSQSDISKKGNVLNFMGQILENSADPGKQRPKWYDNFIYATIEGLSSKNQNHPEVQKAAALALSKGGHFIEKSNAEQILDSVLLSDHFELISVLIKQSLGTRPNELDFQQLFDLKKAETLAIIYNDKAAFERDLSKILNFINEDFGLQLLIRVFEQNNDISNDIMEKVLKACLKNTNNSKKYEFLTQLSPKLDSNFGPTISEVLEDKTEDEKVVEALICYCNPDLMNSIKLENLSHIFKDGNDSETSAHLKASIANKLKNPKPALEVVSPDSTPRQVLWITKGLVYRKIPYPGSKVWIDKLLQMIGQGHDVEFEILVKNIEPFLICPNSQAALARQKIFNLTKPSLIQTFHQGVYPSQHLKALICQLPYVPKFTLAHEISNLLPLLMNGLQEANQDDVLTLASLTCLQDLILHEPNKFGSYLSTLLPVWLKIAKNKEKSINLRIKALNCIQTVTKAETQDLVPYKKEVINGLIPALDDHKRLVRQAATSARNSWCLS